MRVEGFQVNGYWEEKPCGIGAVRGGYERQGKHRTERVM